MKRISLFIVLIASLSSCRWMHFKRIEGSGNITTETRSISHPQRIKLSGSYDVEITQGAAASLKVEADDNLQSYILTDETGGALNIHSRDHYNLSSEHGIKIYITTDKLEEVNLSGSGNVKGMTKFFGGDKLVIKISGSGNMDLEVNTPTVDASISGSGTMNIKGETQEQKIQLSGVGDYKASEMKSEKTNVRITGAGNAWVFADASLDVNIAGVGSVYYKGNPEISQHIAGAGEIKKQE